MEKKKSLKPSVYRPTRIFKEIDDVILKQVDEGKYSSYNGALNKLLAKQLKLPVKRCLTVRDLKKKDTFRFINHRATRVYRILDECKREPSGTNQTRRCKNVATGKIISIPCKSEIVKL